MEINKKNAKVWSRLGPRATYGLEILDLVSTNERIYALSADLGVSSGLSRLMETYPEHYLNTGIAEQNLIGVAAGIAKEGLIPFVSSFAPFITHRCADQIRMNMGYMHLNIKAVGIGSGISMSILGNSHYGTDDIAFMSAIPNLTILSPCDCAELVMCIDAASNFDGPVYIRLTGEPGLPVVYEEDFGFQIGKAHKIREGEDIFIVSTGTMVEKAVKVSKILEEQGISATVFDMHTIKPLDYSIFSNISKKCKLLVTVEEHSVVGGLGASIAQYVANEGLGLRVLNIGLPDEYLKAGSYEYMLKEYGLTVDEILNKILLKYRCKI